MNAEHTTEKEHNRKTDEEEIEKIKEDLELATEKVVYFEDNKSRRQPEKIAESKIILTESKKLGNYSAY